MLRAAFFLNETLIGDFRYANPWGALRAQRRNCESGFAAVVIGMTWTILILVLVMAFTATKLARHSFTLLAAAASITMLVWLLIGRPSDHPHDREAQNGGSRASLTSRVIP